MKGNTPGMGPGPWYALAIPMLLGSAHAYAAEPGGAAARLPEVEVVDTTPLHGLTIARDLIPAPVQAASDADIQRSNALALPDFLQRNLGSVHINDMAGNPFQPDVNYRGFVASPVLGTPQGLSVYMDGVRMNQPFGDVVSWDLIPRAAIASLNLMPGSNPLFGLNTLGGALSIQTKDGRTHPGAALQVYGGMNARRAAEFEYGSSRHSLDWFVTGNLFRERGWRDDSPSRIGQLFAKVGWRNAASEAKLTLAHAHNTLQGSALQEERLLQLDYNSLYTKPDINENISTLLNLALSHSISDNTLISGNVYYRKLLTRTLNADINEGALDQALYQPNAAERAALAAAGYSGFPLAGANAGNTPFPFWRCIGNVLLNDEPAEKCNALINRTRTAQDNFGFSVQGSTLATLAGVRHQITAGTAYDANSVTFRQTTQLGYLNADRSVTGLNAFADGVTGGTVDGVPFDHRVELDGRAHTWSAYATDTLSFRDLMHVTVSGRYNRTRTTNSDRLNPGGGPGSLDGNYTFSRFNPAAGVSFTPGKSVRAYLGYSEGSRAPTAIELGCADPANPCRLPNSLAGDPPLRQVVTRTWEAGLHGRISGSLRWNAGVFRAENNDDILFVAAPDNNQFGYFKNVGKTRREGLELGLSGNAGGLQFGANYTVLNATYQTAETLAAVGNSSNDSAAAGNKGLDGSIGVVPGNRIPLIPRQLFKAHADYDFGAGLSASLSLLASGSSHARGNENNQHVPDGVNYLGSGKSAGYAVLNLGTQYRSSRQLRFFAQVNNLLDRRYTNAAQLGPNGFTANGSFIARPFPANGNGNFPLQQSAFYAPGAPRTAWIGVRYQFDKPASAR